MVVYLDSFCKIAVFKEVPKYWHGNRLIKELTSMYIRITRGQVSAVKALGRDQVEGTNKGK